MSAQAAPESWFHSVDFDAERRRRRAQQRVFYRQNTRGTKEAVADPDDFQPSVVAARDRYFDKKNDPKRRAGGDVRQALPLTSDLETLADTFGTAPARLDQATELNKRGLATKAKRLVLCGRIGHRLNCTSDEHHRFFQPYLCRCRYCRVCGPSWFRRQFADLLAALEPVAERLIDDGQRSGRKMVVAKLDFTVPNSGVMPSPEFVRKFNVDVRRFWRAVERRFGISRQEYGVLGSDEFGELNTNLHRHCCYIGPFLPQGKTHRELSALWSEIRGERSFVSIKSAHSFAGALAHALMYPAKYLDSSTPQRLAELEATFHGTRRFSRGGVFYNITPSPESGTGDCPICHAPLCEIVEPWISRFALEAEGRRSIGDVRREVGRERVFSGAVPP